MKIQNRDGTYFVPVNKNGKWGMVDWNDGTVIVPFEYDTLEDVPTEHLEKKKSY